MSGIREITEKVCEGEHHSSKVLSAILEKLSRLEDNQEMERLRSVKIVQQNSKILTFFFRQHIFRKLLF